MFIEFSTEDLHPVFALHLLVDDFVQDFHLGVEVHQRRDQRQLHEVLADVVVLLELVFEVISALVSPAQDQTLVVREVFVPVHEVCLQLKFLLVEEHEVDLRVGVLPTLGLHLEFVAVLELFLQFVEDHSVDLEHTLDVQVYFIEQPEDVALLGFCVLEGEVVLTHVFQLLVEEFVLRH